MRRPRSRGPASRSRAALSKTSRASRRREAGWEGRPCPGNRGSPLYYLWRSTRSVRAHPNVFGRDPARSRVGKAWVKARRRDPFYREAKAQGYRSRAAFKLIQIDARFDLIYEGDVVLDLGAAPGGWSQVAHELVGASGRVVAVDRVGMRPLEGIEVWRGDLEDPALLAVLA